MELIERKGNPNFRLKKRPDRGDRERDKKISRESSYERATFFFFFPERGWRVGRGRRKGTDEGVRISQNQKFMMLLCLCICIPFHACGC
jgi:hypothetical protein